MVVIFFGTLDQVHYGIHGATERYFYSFFVWARIEAIDISVPYMPGGYLLGLILLINVITVATTRFKFSARKAGIWFIHVGVVLLLLGEFVSSVFQEEATMTIDEGATANYTESLRESELALIDVTDPDVDRVYAIPEKLLERRQQVNIDELPFTVSVVDFLPNSVARPRDQGPTQGMTLATRGLGTDWVAIEIPETGKMDERNIPSTTVTLYAPPDRGKEPEIIGTWLVREFMPSQAFTYDGREYELQLRRKREYLDYEITLVDFSHDRYLGTNIPKNFSSEIILRDNDTSEERDFLIYMNNPLRFDDLTFYQQGFMNDDKTSILQVVRNPGRLLPYISCSIITLGLLYQFGTGLFRFMEKRKAKA